MHLWKFISTTSILSLSLNAGASIVSVDWLTSGDNLITQDTVSGLEWLDLTVTTSRSYNDISSKLGPGQEFDGWRYASTNEISGFWDAFGGDNNHYVGWSVENNGLFDAIAPYWGDTQCEFAGCSPGEGYSFAITGDARTAETQYRAKLFDDILDPRTAEEDFFTLTSGYVSLDETSYKWGHALVRVVPVPAAVWLFGSGLIGLIGVARRKYND
jgi:hypothetical protein